MNRILLFVIVATTFLSKAQNNTKAIDSMLLSMKKGTEKQKFITLLNIADEYSNFDLDKAIEYSNKCLYKAKKMKNDSLIGLSYNAIANNFQYKTVLDSALKYHNKAIKIRLEINDSIGIADTYNNLGILYDTKGDFSAAISYYFKALYFYEKKNKIAKQAMVNANIGIVYKAQKEYQKAYPYYQNSFDLYSKISDKLGTIISAGNLGSILINLKKYKESIKYTIIAKEGYKKNGYDRYLGYPISNLAFVYDSLKQYQIANKHYINAIELQEKAGNNYEVAEISASYAGCLIKQSRYQESINLSLKALQFAQKSDAKLIKILGYKNLSKAYSKTNNYKEALRFSELFIAGNDSVFKTEKNKDIFELETKYQTTKKEKQIIQQQADAKQKNLYIIGISILTLLASLIGFLIYRQQKIKNQQQTQEFELKTAINQIENQSKLQEQRLSISRDLHDNIGSQLTFIISSVDNIKHGFDIQNEKLDTKLTNISSFAKDTIVELRDTIWAMNSNEFTFEDLEIRINNFIEKAKLSRENIIFSFAIDLDLKNQKLSSVQGMNIYRTIQEAINNSLKYAQAEIISVNIKKQDLKTKISISDNGVGFDIETIEKGNGLNNMQKRIQEIGGKFALNSNEDGTKIELLMNY